jgi:mitochondrial import inner membrane translocase subunit TIM23
MAWSMTDNLLEEIRETSDYYNHCGAAFLSGALFKSTAGIRPAVLTGGILSFSMMAYGAVEKLLSKSRNVHFQTRAQA